MMIKANLTVTVPDGNGNLRQVHLPVSLTRKDAKSTISQSSIPISKNEVKDGKNENLIQETKEKCESKLPRLK